MANMLRANTNAVLTVTELAGQVTVREGQTYDVSTHEWAAVLREHPWVFDENVVEQATAAPGEKRSTRRAAKK